ncbi:MAG: LuxR C-terminal-related transcriptional regulator [Oscillospiraceae bacterium]|nr:LuxR C-terminal-related transcriptional regulator [Oscillospiraceae bacterium]
MEQGTARAQAPRTTLMKLLDGLLGSRVIYVHAPAGYGKTASSFLWLEHRASIADTRHSWTCLDEHDNKVAEFCKRCVCALASIQPENGFLRELATHRAFSTAPVEFALQALNAFDDVDEHCILVIDDLHLVTNPEILKLLPDFIKRLPKSCTILLLSRFAPPDSFSEMVSYGELAVVDAAYLQFTSDEIKIYFNKNKRYVTSAQADEILASTGGWAIGIRALLLAGEKSYSTDLTGKYLENFLKTHVWERWDEQLKCFMTCVSVMKELTPGLCNRLIAGQPLLKKASAAEILAKLARENAFLRQTDSNTYRFHDLFRDFLLSILEESGEDAALIQWNKAGDYFYDKQDYFRSVKYYLNGKNDGGVAKSLYNMYDYKSTYASVEDTLYTVRIAVTDAMVEKHLFLLEVQTWAAFVEGRADDMERYMDRYYKLFPKIVLQNPRSAIIMIFIRSIDHRTNIIKTFKTLRLVPFKGTIRAYTPSVTHSMPLFHRSSRDYSEVAVDVERNIELLEKTVGVVFGAEFPVIRDSLVAGFNYERGNLDQACEYALGACASIPEGCSAEMKFCAMMILSAALYANNQKAESERIIAAVKEMIDTDKAFYLKPNLRAYMFRLRLTNGDTEAARDWLKDSNGNLYEALTFFKVYQHFTTARAYISLGDYNHAILLLKKLLQLAERYRRTLDIIEIHILLAVCYWKKGKSGNFTALDYLEKAVASAYEYGFTQVFANEGAELVNMLHRLQKRAIQKDYAGVSGEFVKRLYISAVSESKRTKGLTGGSVPANLTLTDKQKTVMRLMCEGCSRNKIAEQMGLKPNSVKTHTELIYRKLDVSSSVEAILKIKELGVLSESAKPEGNAVAGEDYDASESSPPPPPPPRAPQHAAVELGVTDRIFYFF